MGVLAMDNHIETQKAFLLDGYAHFHRVARNFTVLGQLTQANFCTDLAEYYAKAWQRVDKGLNPFGHAGLEDDQPESACSGAMCELKQAGLDVGEMMKEVKPST